jgi:RimK-like ATP-grasp domain
MLQLRAIPGPTGRMLREMLDEKGLLGGRVQGIVNYGYAEASGLPTLNAHAGRVNKYQELVTMDDAGVRTIPFSRNVLDLEPPIFGRKLHHTRGQDIFVYQVKPLLRGDRLSDYYTQLVPKQNEFRTWVFRDKHLATYNKHLDYPEKYGKRGRNKEVWNWANGFAYTFVQPEAVHAKLKTLAIAAVDALDLDFGAVDAILGADRHFYVLEVNTAPGVQDRRQGFTSLVNCIEKWAKGGFPGRD